MYSILVRINCCDLSRTDAISYEVNEAYTFLQFEEQNMLPVISIFYSPVAVYGKHVDHEEVVCELGGICKRYNCISGDGRLHVCSVE